MQRTKKNTSYHLKIRCYSMGNGAIIAPEDHKLVLKYLNVAHPGIYVRTKGIYNLFL